MLSGSWPRGKEREDETGEHQANITFFVNLGAKMLTNVFPQEKISSRQGERDDQVLMEVSSRELHLDLGDHDCIYYKTCFMFSVYSM